MMETYNPILGLLPRIGNTVKVVRAIDETTDRDFIGKSGSVVELNLHHGCGEHDEYPDPLIKVAFAREVTEQFWAEELSPVPYHVHRLRCSNEDCHNSRFLITNRIRFAVPVDVVLIGAEYGAISQKLIPVYSNGRIASRWLNGDVILRAVRTLAMNHVRTTARCLLCEHRATWADYLPTDACNRF